MHHRARGALPSALPGLALAVLVGLTTSACGEGGAPEDASAETFCDAATGLGDALAPGDLMAGEMPAVPTAAELERAVRAWGARLEEVGTPADMPAEARARFDDLVAQAREGRLDDVALPGLTTGSLPEQSQEWRDEVTAWSDYLVQTCGAPLGDLDLPAIGGGDNVIGGGTDPREG